MIRLCTVSTVQYKSYFYVEYKTSYNKTIIFWVPEDKFSSYKEPINQISSRHLLLFLWRIPINIFEVFWFHSSHHWNSFNNTSFVVLTWLDLKDKSWIQNMYRHWKVFSSVGIGYVGWTFTRYDKSLTCWIILFLSKSFSWLLETNLV